MKPIRNYCFISFRSLKHIGSHAYSDYLRVLCCQMVFPRKLRDMQLKLCKSSQGQYLAHTDEAKSCPCTSCPCSISTNPSIFSNNLLLPFFKVCIFCLVVCSNIYADYWTSFIPWNISSLDIQLFNRF